MLQIIDSVINSPELKDCTNSEKWYIQGFNKCEVPLTNIKKVCAYIHSIPCSNAHAERVFSLMTSAWTKERNRLDVDTVMAELQIFTNISLECSDMFKVFLNYNFF